MDSVPGRKFPSGKSRRPAFATPNRRGGPANARRAGGKLAGSAHSHGRPHCRPARRPRAPSRRRGGAVRARHRAGRAENQQDKLISTVSHSTPNLGPMNTQFTVRLAALGIRTEDVEERFVLGSGRGGQKIQKTSSCVWVRHRLTGVEVRCQRERSQVANRESAWLELCSKLEERIWAAAAVRQDEQAKSRRRSRQKSRGQKVRMIQSKKHRAKTKSGRGRVGTD